MLAKHTINVLNYVNNMLKHVHSFYLSDILSEERINVYLVNPDVKRGFALQWAVGKSGLFVCINKDIHPISSKGWKKILRYNLFSCMHWNRKLKHFQWLHEYESRLTPESLGWEKTENSDIKWKYVRTRPEKRNARELQKSGSAI